jgi:hypothetical protein
MPIPGAAEAPGAMCVTVRGRWLVCYAPYNTFDPSVRVERNQIVVLYSDDRGRTWNHTSMFRFSEVDSGGAEAWLIELTDGRLQAACWHFDYRGTEEYANPFALSTDGGNTWLRQETPPILGQSTALAPLPDGRALLVYSQRKHGDRGIWLSLLTPAKSCLDVDVNQIVWRAEVIAESEHANWRQFSFGEPSVTVLRDKVILVTLWCIQPSGRGIRYVRLKLED